MKITYNDPNMKKEIMKEIKKFSPKNIMLHFDLTSLVLTVKLSKEYYNNYVYHNIMFDFKVEYASNCNKIILSELQTNDVIFNLILDDCFITPYSKNLTGIKINEYNYWMDTLVIEDLTHKKRIKHNEIVFESTKLIYAS